MWIADNWTDYEVLDTSGGEKLERWGNYLLIRPDPQVIWSTPQKAAWLEKARRALPPQRKGGRRMGILSPAPAVEHPIQGADLSAETL